MNPSYTLQKLVYEKIIGLNCPIRFSLSNRVSRQPAKACRTIKTNLSQTNFCRVSLAVNVRKLVVNTKKLVVNV